MDSIESDKNLVFVTVEMMRPGITAAVFSETAHQQFTVVCPVFVGPSVYFFTHRNAVSHLQKYFGTLVTQGFMKKIDIDVTLSPIFLKGKNLEEYGRSICEVLDILHGASIHPHFGSICSSIIVLAVRAVDVDDALKVLNS